MTKWLVAVFIMLAALSSAAAAQGVTGTVSGTVKDPQGAAFLVRPSHSSANRRARDRHRSSPTPRATSSFPNIAADTYTLQIEMPSFKH